MYFTQYMFILSADVLHIYKIQENTEEIHLQDFLFL